jgi:hypothetical protein
MILTIADFNIPIKEYYELLFDKSETKQMVEIWYYFDTAIVFRQKDYHVHISLQVVKLLLYIIYGYKYVLICLW